MIPSNGTIRRDDLTNKRGQIPAYMTCKMKSPGGNSALHDVQNEISRWKLALHDVQNEISRWKLALHDV